jgi:IS30 family transposase
MRVSHETIYRSLYLQTQGALHRQLIRRLRTKRLMRRGKKASTAGQRRGLETPRQPDSSVLTALSSGRGDWT